MLDIEKAGHTIIRYFNIIIAIITIIMRAIIVTINNSVLSIVVIIFVILFVTIVNDIAVMGSTLSSEPVSVDPLLWTRCHLSNCYAYFLTVHVQCNSND